MRWKAASAACSVFPSSAGASASAKNGVSWTGELELGRGGVEIRVLGGHREGEVLRLLGELLGGAGALRAGERLLLGRQGEGDELHLALFGRLQRALPLLEELGHVFIGHLHAGLEILELEADERDLALLVALDVLLAHFRRRRRDGAREKGAHFVQPNLVGDEQLDIVLREPAMREPVVEEELVVRVIEGAVGLKPAHPFDRLRPLVLRGRDPERVRLVAQHQRIPDVVIDRGIAHRLAEHRAESLAPAEAEEQVGELQLGAQLEAVPFLLHGELRDVVAVNPRHRVAVARSRFWRSAC